MLKAYYKSPDHSFNLLNGDCFELLPQFDFKFDMIFADPPYFLSNDGISVQAGKIVSVNKGEWDKGGSPDEINDFNKRWIGLCRDKLKDNGTIWISGTYHNIFSVANSLTELGFKILNVVTWAKTNPPPNISCRYYYLGTEIGQETSSFQLRTDETFERQQANDRCVAAACHCAVGKIVRQASDAKAAGTAHPNYSSIDGQKRLDSRPICRFFDDRHCCQSRRQTLSRNRKRSRICGYQPETPRGNRSFQNL